MDLLLIIQEPCNISRRYTDQVYKAHDLIDEHKLFFS